jgi:acyl dehydratase
MIVLIMQVRFAKHVLPGETLRTEMWQVDPVTVVFQTRVVERNVLAITNAAMVFKQPVQMGGKQQQQQQQQQQQRTQAKL